MTETILVVVGMLAGLGLCVLIPALPGVLRSIVVCKDDDEGDGEASA